MLKIDCNGEILWYCNEQSGASKYAFNGYIIIVILREKLYHKLSFGRYYVKVHPCTGTGALYRPYGPWGE